MDQEKLIALLRHSQDPDPGPTAFCADDHAVAAYVDGVLDTAAHQSIQRHVADCEWCSRRITMLVELQRGMDDEQQPTAAALDRALRKGRRRDRWSASRWAAAAAVVLAIFFVADFPSDDGIETDDEPMATRTVDRSTSALLQLLSPENGDVVDARDLTFRWQPVENSLHYELTVVTESGDLVAQQRVIEPEWDASQNLDLRAGAKYFVRVDAVMPDARTVSSRHVSFRTEEPD